MNSLIIIGWKSGGIGEKAQPECLYCGLDGTKATAIAAAALKTNEFSRIGKLVNPMAIPINLPPIEQIHENKQAEAKSLEQAPLLKNEFTKAALSGKEKGELLNLATELLAAGRIASLPEKTTKGELIEAILSATPLPTDPQ